MPTLVYIYPKFFVDTLDRNFAVSVPVCFLCDFIETTTEAMSFVGKAGED